MCVGVCVNFSLLTSNRKIHHFHFPQKSHYIVAHCWEQIMSYNFIYPWNSLSLTCQIQLRVIYLQYFCSESKFKYRYVYTIYHLLKSHLNLIRTYFLKENIPHSRNFISEDRSLLYISLVDIIHLFKFCEPIEGRLIFYFYCRLNAGQSPDWSFSLWQLSIFRLCLKALHLISSGNWVVHLKTFFSTSLYIFYPNQTKCFFEPNETIVLQFFIRY